ncbi:cryptococcal mannosyltransferase 1-domain-containing protein [Leucosporidium creatinivorum]|uniref:Cryptococcal mannosyltransferase 1-domain-containing protein n=1 Tax=Leucosporidium creatinivorum TaxID=106004 RepID=A0A1Y2G0A8_9BASI|nr:cryptococcal mannosyltransferase 1-domain-containing protein [Leucosporidium creatinivorum]
MVQPFGLAEDPSREAVQAHLDKRLLELSAPPSTLSCSWSTTDETKYAALPSGGPYFFALNLYNNQAVLPTLARTLLDLAHFLGTANTHISIFENGSTDNTTLALAHFAAALTSAGVSHTIVSDSRKTDWKKVDRIAQLSVYRNYALSPVNGTVGGKDGRERSFEEVVFINDVFVCPRDALELLWQRKKQNAHAACAMDWRATQSWFGWLGFKSVKFYDNWVSRTITGDMLRSRFDTLAETRDGIDELFDQPGSEFSRDLFSKGLPVPVYSCWNGMLALPAAPFRGANGPATLFRSTFNEPGQCAASECKTLARDFWAQGLNRWMIVPSVHVTYAQEVYNHPSLVDLTRRGELNAQATSSIIDWEPIKPPESVVCYSWVRGFHIDLPYRRTREAPFR